MRVGPRRRLLAALVALAAAWIAVPSAVPLYDGINFPDEPYRYVVPPAGYQHTPLPLSAKGTSVVAEGTNAATIYVNTDEVAPQVNVVIPNRLLAVAAGSRTVTVSAAPIAPDRQPGKGTIDGNVYRVLGVSEPAAAVTFAPPPGDAATVSSVTMRATSARRPAPTFLYRAQPAQPWRVLTTYTFGNDVYRTQFAGFGDYALAFGVLIPAAHSSSGLAIGLSALLAVVLLAAGAVLAVRLSRRHGHQDAASPP